MKKKKIRFFNKPVKIGLGLAGFGATLEIGSADIYTLIEDPKLIFWLEVCKYICYGLSFIFSASGVAKQAKEDLKSIKVGEKVKEVVKQVEKLESVPRDTFSEEHEAKQEGFKKVFELAKDVFKVKKK